MRNHSLPALILGVFWKGATRIAVQGDHRSLVTRTEREQLPMVPGPEEPQ